MTRNPLDSVIKNFLKWCWSLLKYHSKSLVRWPKVQVNPILESRLSTYVKETLDKERTEGLRVEKDCTEWFKSSVKILCDYTLRSESHSVPFVVKCKRGSGVEGGIQSTGPFREWCPCFKFPCVFVSLVLFSVNYIIIFLFIVTFL